ncbi:MAG: sugar nucleotide-binding protein [Candidatus Peribacteraceae bacterium]|jgi:dTDP-4-dehydrorhamnose reductase|nr:sugar nucleotide-binding protein [Candidatus Peribacteraceae bacterium]
MTILLFGGRGYMGGQFLQIYPDAITPSVDIADAAGVEAVLDAEKPDLVINAAGKTGVPNVDWCEEHKLETFHSNVLGPLVLLEACQKRSIYWVHLSSGCVYSGDNGGRGFAETDEPNFTGSYYSRTKAACERSLRDFPMLILRLRMPFDGSPHPRNLLTKLAQFERVLDTENSITCLPDFLDAAEALIARRATGIYNIVNEGAISPYRIMELYREIVDPAHCCERLLPGSLSQVVRAGRSNCVLSTEKLKEEGISLRPVEEAVRSALMEYKKSAVGPKRVETLNKNCVQC